MIGAIRSFWDNFRGAGEAAVTVPPMDGALRPNRAVEDGELLASAAAPDNLALVGDRILFSTGATVIELGKGRRKDKALETFDSDVTALACSGDGALAVGLAGGGLRIVGGAHDGKQIETVDGRRLNCVTALAFASANELLVANGSATRPADEWKHDLMERNVSGSVWSVDLASGKATLLADRLAWPYGIALTPEGDIAVSESWAHRVILLPKAGGAAKTVLADLPGYPARLSPSSSSGMWLSVFAPRGQLTEFILRETEFRRRMMADIAPDYWAAPSLKASSTFLEPLQGGAQKHLGMLKPWAPTRSYGLVVHIDAKFHPTLSFHSRADGTRHGITSAMEHDGRLIVASKGGDAVVAIELEGQNR
ncbi:MAG: hypothetical protein WBF87_09705 [Mesorhizobium sp.]